MTRFVRDDIVWVPTNRMPGSHPHALNERKVLEVVDRSIVVDDGNGETIKVSTKIARSRSLGFLILRIGDLNTESTLLDPLAKSVLQSMRLLIPDTEVRILHVRTELGVRAFTAVNGASFSHVILIGHGTPASLLAMGTARSGQSAGEMLAAGSPKIVISLACSTGQVGFARPFSRSAAVREFVAPIREAHGAAASLFLQTVLHRNLLRGHTFRGAIRSANEGLEGTHFRHWRDGDLQG